MSSDQQSSLPNIPLQPLSLCELNTRYYQDDGIGEENPPNKITKISAETQETDPFREKYSGLSEQLLADLETDFMAPAKTAMMALTEKDFSEEDPLVIIVPDLSNPDSIHYWHYGNFGLPVRTPGALPWPRKMYL
jgi:hypothetical protein